MLLDELMPASDVSTRHAIRVAAPPARASQAARTADLAGPWVVRVLLAIRRLPAAAVKLRGHRPVRGGRANRSIGELHFTVVAEIPGEEIVLAIMGRFWTPTGGVIAAEPDRFRTPPPPGLAQGLWNFRATLCCRAVYVAWVFAVASIWRRHRATQGRDLGAQRAPDRLGPPGPSRARPAETEYHWKTGESCSRPRRRLQRPTRKGVAVWQRTRL